MSSWASRLGRLGQVLREKMPLGSRQAVLPGPRGKFSGPMGWVIAIMVLLCVIAAAGGLAIGNLTRAARADLEGAVTIQLVEANQQLRDEKTRQIALLLSADPEVVSYRIVPQKELSALLDPWLGQTEGESAVPIPALIDVQLRTAADPANIARLKAALKPRVDAVRVDAQSSWLGPVRSALGALQWLAGGITALLAMTAIAAVWLATRNAFAGQRETIEIIHLLGGSDAQLARIFQRSVAFDALVGGVVGLGLGVVGVFAIGGRFAALDSGMLGAGGLTIGDWLIIGAIPLAAIVLATLTARLTVLAALRRML